MYHKQKNSTKGLLKNKSDDLVEFIYHIYCCLYIPFLFINSLIFDLVRRSHDLVYAMLGVVDNSIREMTMIFIFAIISHHALHSDL
jgi:hypothetical protein